MLDLSIRDIGQDRAERRLAAHIVGQRLAPDASEAFVYSGDRDYFDNIRTEIILGSYVGGDLVGTAGAHLGPPMNPTGIEYLHVDVLATREDHEGLGIGSEMLAKLERLATLMGRNAVCLFPIDETEGFYEERGYLPDGLAYIKPLVQLSVVDTFVG